MLIDIGEQVRMGVELFRRDCVLAEALRVYETKVKFTLHHLRVTDGMVAIDEPQDAEQFDGLVV